MVGFIGALSSSLAILILVFITLLLGYIDSMLPEKSLFQLSEATYRYPLQSYFITDAFKPEMEDLIKNHQNNTKQTVKSVNIGCTAGFDMSNESAMNIMVYNTIKLTSFNLSVPVIMEREVTDKPEQLNYCFIDLEGGE